MNTFHSCERMSYPEIHIVRWIRVPLAISFRKLFYEVQAHGMPVLKLHFSTPFLFYTYYGLNIHIFAINKFNYYSIIITIIITEEKRKIGVH